MKRRTRAVAWLSPGVGIAVLLGSAPAVNAQASQPVDRWIARHAVPLATADPSAPLDDLAPLRRSVGDAAVVGLGESVHGTAEETTLKLRALRFLVERMGFRSIAWEEDWTMGLTINEYVLTGKGDPDALVRDMSFQWRTREMADVLRWLRAYNAGQKEKVRFVGVEYYFTRPLAYDGIKAYVAKTAPERLPELRKHKIVRPWTSDMPVYTSWFKEKVEDKRSYVRHARQVYELVKDLPDGGRDHEVALHHARQIVSFYEHFLLEFNEANAYRDAHAAKNLAWWRTHSGGDKIVYWGASAHTSNAPELHVTAQNGQDLRYPTAGSHLRRRYGQRYRSIGFTLGHGEASLGPGQTVALARPAPNWFERRFGEVRAAQFVLDLRSPTPAPVRRWLDAPAATRGLPHFGAGSTTTGGSLSQWFDVIVHRHEVSPAQPA
ncbi:erythromycin esterase family protein [Actinomadura sp. KC06]|uniref:erythromycin esterase family protein n=1 Tax=Actinomadura sp. KC06 TaxID=2530369 RepID=UPI00104FE5A1|nr:erythromycin esterase family protein [Actinomadura sp. KC06]TDD40235.1 erythromycin esterase family protein [Actinomadura sp. KC06]